MAPGRPGRARRSGPRATTPAPPPRRAGRSPRPTWSISAKSRSAWTQRVRVPAGQVVLLAVGPGQAELEPAGQVERESRLAGPRLARPRVQDARGEPSLPEPGLVGDDPADVGQGRSTPAGRRPPRRLGRGPSGSAASTAAWIASRSDGRTGSRRGPTWRASTGRPARWTARRRNGSERACSSPLRACPVPAGGGASRHQGADHGRRHPLRPIGGSSGAATAGPCRCAGRGAGTGRRIARARSCGGTPRGPWRRRPGTGQALGGRSSGPAHRATPRPAATDPVGPGTRR